jgi:type IV pilus assembly protein PilQ
MGRGWLLGFALALLASPAAWAQTQIRAINASQQAGVDVVRIELSEPLAAADGLHHPGAAAHRGRPAGRRQRPGRNQVDINQGNLRSASVARRVSARASC